jgi:hypothetical protein
MGSLGILAVAGLVLVPLFREYADFRRAWGLGRAAAVGVTGLVVPAVAIGVVVALPLAAWPYAQWGVTIAVSLAAYSLAVRAVEAAVEPARSSEGR